MSTRSNPLADLSDFMTPGPLPPRPDAEAVRAIAEANGFPDRSARTPSPKREQRRYRTGRNAQLNIRVSPEAVDRFVAISDRHGWIFSQALDAMMDAFEVAERSSQLANSGQLASSWPPARR
jgi:hypothetical protein